MEETKITSPGSLEEFLKNNPQPVSEETAQRITEQLQPEESTPADGGGSSDQSAAVPEMNLADFAGIAVKLYKGISNRVFEMIKDKPAPSWDKETTEALNEAARNCLKGYNVPMSPGWQLLITIATIEIVRYTVPKIEYVSPKPD